MADDNSLRHFMGTHWQALLARTAEHLELSGITIFSALVIGVTLAVLTYRHARLRTLLLAITSLLQTIPGIALLVMAMALFHRIGTVPALFALLLYALLPIVQNTLVGLGSLTPALSEAVRGLGLSRWQRLYYVRLPLALPVIVAGLRISAVQTVGLATLAAFVGAGGLGQFINRGLFLSDTRLILLGAVPAALIALLIHVLLGLLGQSMAQGHSLKIKRMMLVVSILGIILMATFTLIYTREPQAAANHITVGSKNFTEQLIVAEIVAQQIEKQTHLPVVRRFGMGGSTVVHQALMDGTVDISVEYTGTALSAILHEPTPADHNDVFAHVRDAYAKRFQLQWFPPLGFNNSYALAVRKADARLADGDTISALVVKAPFLTAAFDFEFAERADGYKGLAERYGLHFGHVTDMHPDLLYRALRSGEVDVISAYTTDGRLADSGFMILKDDQHFFPPYDAAIVIRKSTLQAHPELEKPLGVLSGSFTDEKMRALNAAVDRKEISVEQAAARFFAGK